LTVIPNWDILFWDFSESEHMTIGERNMARTPGTTKASAFDKGFESAIEALADEIRALYLEDEVPWVIGYSGGKDSSAVLQLVWMAIAKLPEERRTKPIHVISTDTLVENPVVAAWVGASLAV